MTRIPGKPVGLMAALALAAATLTGPAGAASGEIVVVQGSDVLTLDPSANSASVSINLYLNVFDQLTRIEDDGALGPGLAASWDVNEDATEWIFHMVEGVRFHDGSPLTSADVVGTFELILDNPRSPVRSYLNTVETIEALDDKTVRITLKEPFITFGRQVSLVSVLPVETYRSMGAEAFSARGIGSGPFRVEEWVKDSHVTLVANEDYWDGAPEVAKVTFRAMPSEPSRVAGLVAGEIDIVPLLAPPLVPTVESQAGANVVKRQSNRTVYLGYNSALESPLADVRVRKAIDHAIDRTTITERLLQGLGTPTGQIPAPVLFGHDPEIEPTAYDPDLSRQLLAEAGYDGTPIRFEYPTNRWAFAPQTAQAIEGYLSEVGLNIEMQPMEFSAFFPLWLNDQLTSMYMFSLGITIMDADLILNLEYESETSHGYWSSPEVDELARRQRASTDEAERRALMSQIWKISQENAVFAPLYSEIQAYGIRDCVTWEPRADERMNFVTARSTCSH